MDEVPQFLGLDEEILEVFSGFLDGAVGPGVGIGDQRRVPGGFNFGRSVAELKSEDLSLRCVHGEVYGLTPGGLNPASDGTGADLQTPIGDRELHRVACWRDFGQSEEVLGRHPDLGVPMALGSGADGHAAALDVQTGAVEAENSFLAVFGLAEFAEQPEGFVEAGARE